MEDEYPRLLFFTFEIPQTRNAGSMQLYRVLQGYPGERIRVIGPPMAEGATGLPCVYKTRGLFTYRLVNTRFRRWITGLSALDLWPEPGLSKTESLVEEFKPDFVVTVMDHFAYYKHAWKLARRLGVRLITVTMDDPQIFEDAHPMFQGAYDRLLSRLYRSTALSIGVSREMCDFLHRRFGRASDALYFGPPDGLQIRAQEESLRLRNPRQLTLAFAGSLSLGYPEGIRSLLPALEAANVRLNVYTQYKNAIEHPCIVNRGFFSPEKLWPVIQEECDAVLLPYAFEGEILKLYRTHFPTKISEYCWTGMPIVIAGPESATGVRWGLDHPEAALVATERKPSVWISVFERLRSDNDLRSRLAAGSATLARTEFEPGASRRRFVELVRQAWRESDIYRDRDVRGTPSRV